MKDFQKVLKKLQEELDDIELVDKDLGQFLEESQSAFNELILTFLKERLENPDSYKEEGGDWLLVKKGPVFGI